MDTNPVAQIEIARNNPLPTAIGALAGIVPVGVFEFGHYELTSWDPSVDGRALIVYAGLVFSAISVVTWSRDIFTPANAGRWGGVLATVKAVGFTALVEGMMMTSDNRWLSGAALGLLVAINAVANGCRLAVRAAGTKATESERAAARPQRASRPRNSRIAQPKLVTLRAVGGQ